MITIADIEAAAARIAGVAHRTPVARCRTLDALAGGRELHFKCEQLQRVGAFKFRGAFNALRSLPREALAAGVVTHSSGNHAQALALAAQLCGATARVVMPRDAKEVKKQAVRGYGAEVTLCEPTLDARQRAADAILAEHGGRFVPPYDDVAIISGQGTVALELLEQAPALDAIIAPVGGGGLLSGVCLAARARAPHVRLFAAEPRGADDCARSMARGELVPQTAPDTIADGLLTSLGELCWPVIRDHVERVITVSDEAIIAAMRLCWTRAKLLIEPSAASAVAAALSEEFRALSGIERVGVVLSGGNVDIDALPW
ncbi:MAG: pyridoxal-phosphate dependent enzyme [Myxococcales bacterium]|nr:pyridoxal-phosphate dependent enzyme [Myxococcales bacterium]